MWFPNLAPSAEIIQLALTAENDRQWNAFAKKYRSEMSSPEISRTLDLLTALLHTTNFSIACYCENEFRCHRPLLRDLLQQRGAAWA